MLDATPGVGGQSGRQQVGHTLLDEDALDMRDGARRLLR